jgi:hypothetical protein
MNAIAEASSTGNAPGAQNNLENIHLTPKTAFGRMQINMQIEATHTHATVFDLGRPAGKKFTLPVSCFATFVGNQISEIHLYWRDGPIISELAVAAAKNSFRGGALGAAAKEDGDMQGPPAPSTDLNTGSTVKQEPCSDDVTVKTETTEVENHNFYRSIEKTGGVRRGGTPSLDTMGEARTGVIQIQPTSSKACELLFRTHKSEGAKWQSRIFIAENFVDCLNGGLEKLQMWACANVSPYCSVADQQSIGINSAVDYKGADGLVLFFQERLQFMPGFYVEFVAVEVDRECEQVSVKGRFTGTTTHKEGDILMGFPVSSKEISCLGTLTLSFTPPFREEHEGEHPHAASQRISSLLSDQKALGWSKGAAGALLKTVGLPMAHKEVFHKLSKQEVLLCAGTLSRIQVFNIFFFFTNIDLCHQLSQGVLNHVSMCRSLGTSMLS